MRAYNLLLTVGIVAVAGCGDARDVAGPSPAAPPPQLHEVTEGTPDGDYSLYWFDTELTRDLTLTIRQSWAVEPDPWSTECPNNTGSHADGDPAFPGVEYLSAADGRGYFLVQTSAGWRSGLLIVQRACWFDEWNAALEAPESAWVAGVALVGFRTVPFAAKLASSGFPDPSHIFQLDQAELYLGGVLTARFRGELHHEDGLGLML